VVVFFGISGMLIPTSLHGALGDGTRRFLVRRFFRLYPAFWLSLPIGYLACWTLWGKQMSVSGLIANLTMIPTAFGEDVVMGQFWTLETELYFYLVCLVLFLCGALHRMRHLCLTSVGLCIAFVVCSALHWIPASALGQYKGMLYHLAIMFWGACFRQAYDVPRERVIFALGGRLRYALTYRAAVAALSVLIGCIALLMAALDWHHRDVTHFSSSLGYLVGLATFALFATVLRIRARLIAWLGEISYSIYLLHGVPLYVIAWFCKSHGILGAPLGLYMALTVLPTILLSWASYRLVEAPAVRLAHRLTALRRDVSLHPFRVE
jgi:peptidoglycan/LPS O-acetylase OafA/YrhL